MKRLLRSVFTPLGLAVLGLLVLAGWAAVSAGVFDGPIARQVRGHSVYAAPGVEVDTAAAERVIGNRRLVVVFQPPGADLSEVCDDVRSAADGTVVLALSRADDEYDKYPCALLPDADDDNFGKAFVAEQMISSGIDGFADRPVEAVKVIAVNYDLLVRAEIVPDGARTISPSLPRYLVAVAALLAVVIAAIALYVGSRRAARLAVTRREQRDNAADAHSELSAAAAGLAQQIIDLDKAADGRSAKFDRKYRAITADYVDLLPSLSTVDDEVAEPRLRALIKRVDALGGRCEELAKQSG